MQSNCRDMKNKRLSRLVVLLLALCVLASGCAQAEQQNKVKVSIVDSVLFTAENAVGNVEKGEDFIALLSLRAGYEFVSCDYSDYKASEKDGRKDTAKL